MVMSVPAMSNPSVLNGKLRVVEKASISVSLIAILFTHYLYIPRNRFSRFEVLHGAICGIEAHQVWSGSDTSTIDRIHIPPSLTI